MSGLDLDALLALAGGATGGPWEVGDGNDGHVIVAANGETVAGNYDYEDGGIIEPRDTAFIVAARTAVPQLVAEVRRLRAALDAETTPLGPEDEPEIGATVRDGERDRWTRSTDGLWLCIDGDTDPLTWRQLIECWSPITLVPGGDS